jgi:chondroitin-sulfate-ABC endolyase/exolyase
MFTVRLHDIYSDTSFRADKSYFFFDDMVLCMGSGISSADRKNPVSTTLFQDLSGAGKQKTDKIFEDASFAYVVKEGEVRVEKEGKRTIAYVDHGIGARNAAYEYYMLKDKKAAESVAAASPVEVLRRDHSGHIVRRGSVVCAALFTENVSYDGMLVQSVNIPLAYVLEDKGEEKYILSLCEPDMRRPWKLNMNDLSHEDVAQKEKPFETELILDGYFELVNPQPGISVEQSGNKTKVSLTTVMARNYTIELKQN